MLKLRPHHINCLFFYRGMGYSEAFVERMSQIEKELFLRPYTEIEFVVGCDVVCECCPNKQMDHTCKSEKRIVKLDENTLAYYELEIGKRYDFQFIKEQIYKNFDPHKFEAICKGCEWYRQGVCSVEHIESQKVRFKDT